MTNNTETIKFSTPHMRLSSNDKVYWLNQFQMFCDSFNNKEIKYIDFGKQDTRGGFSITLFNHNHTVPKQKYFESKQVMLGYIQGYNEASNINWNDFQNFVKVA